MILLQLRANFGKLHGTLTLHEGLNELCLPNEAGKSTWSAFLLAMLYGIDTRERATRENQNLPAKERYRPWDGSSMEGAIDLIWNGRAITIERRSQGRTPMGAFRAYETESGTPVPELTAENCGRMLCGAERSVFERTAFVRQLGMAVSSDAQLEQRLSALVTTGEEGPSASALEKKLRDLKNKYTYRTGLLPRLQARRDELQAQLSALRAAQAEAMDLSAACAGAEAAHSRLQDLRARIERAQAARRRAGLTELQERETALAARCAALAEQTAGLPDEQMLQLLARSLEDAAERLQTAQLDAAIGVKLPEKPEDLPGFAGCGPDEAAQRARDVQVQWNVLHAVRAPKKLPILLLCAAAVLAGAGLCFVSLPIGLGVAGAGLAAVVLSLVLLRRKAVQAERAAEQAEDLLRPFGTDDPAALSGLAARQGEARTQWQQARQAAQHRGQGCNGQHGQHGEHHAYKAAQLHGKEAVLDVALHGEQHDVAQKHQPAVIKFHDVEERVGDQDPHQQHQAEIEQKTLGNGFVHKREPPFLVLERKKCVAPVYRVLHRLARFNLQNKQLNLALKPVLLSRGFSSIMEL